MFITSSFNAFATGLAIIGTVTAVEFGQNDCHLNPWINATSSSYANSYLQVNGSIHEYGLSYGTYFCAMKVQDGKLQKDWLVNSLDFWAASDDSHINAIQVGYQNGEKTTVIGTTGDQDKKTTITWDPATQYVYTLGTDPQEGNLKGISIRIPPADPVDVGERLEKEFATWGTGTLVGLDGYVDDNGLENLNFFILPKTCATENEPDRKDCNGQWP
ncbi:hypothetical protein BDV96DRAFT_631813 [Lophiotrema nucula]|uniref:Uncharacterized protein n=1 Tax=Lophiotrema nucula TaxID=690887 RepID=A0A6A5Z8X4_9PLEO|nr:hypothetical protein BDV96DRAFT_631813 [Lophiotrema nucula]